MTTKSFFELLAANPQKEVVFEYQPNQFVPVAYHITEVKNVYFESVDCGGNAREEYQTIVQLWISPKDILKQKGMVAKKALKIFNIVDAAKPIKKDTEIYFEYGNNQLPTSSYSIKRVENTDSQLIIKLFVEATACRPQKQAISKAGKVLSCC